MCQITYSSIGIYSSTLEETFYVSLTQQPASFCGHWKQTKNHISTRMTTDVLFIDVGAGLVFS